MNRNRVKSTNKRIYTGICILLLGYFWGGLTVHNEIFPFEQIKQIKNLLTEESEKSLELVPNQYWQQRRDQFEIFGRTADIIMIGDSITHAGHWDDIFPKVKIANRGIGSDRTDDVIARIDNIIAVKPAKAFLMIGINDFIIGRTVDDVFNDYKMIVSYLQKNDTTVFIQSTLECNKSICGNILEEVRSLNSKLKVYASENKIIFIDINKGLTNLEEGLLKIYTYDGIHLLGKGYVIWSKTISPYIFS